MNNFSVISWDYTVTEKIEINLFEHLTQQQLGTGQVFKKRETLKNIHLYNFNTKKTRICYNKCFKLHVYVCINKCNTYQIINHISDKRFK